MRRHPVIKSLFIFVLALAGSGCGERAAAWTAPLQMLGPFEVADRVMWVDTTRGAVFAVDPNPSPPSVARVRIDPRATFALPTPGRKKLLVLGAGQEALKKTQQSLSPGLTVIAVGAAGPIVEHFYPLSSPFDRVAVSPDERLAIAYVSAGSGSGTALLRNPNELALIDLSAAPGDHNPVFRTIRSLGSAPLGIAFSPPLKIGADDPRTLAIVLSKNYLTFVDLDHRDRVEITVPLQPIDATGTVTPRQVVFASDGSAFVRADGASDVFAIALDPRPTSDPSQNDYHPRLNQPSAGKVVRDMLLYSDGGRTLLLTANDSQDLALVDAATSEFSIIPIGAPVDALIPLPKENPTTVIVFSRGSPQPFVSLVTLKGLAQNGARNVVRRTLARDAHDVVPIPGATQALVVHDDARTVFSILDLGPRRTDTPIEGRVPLHSFDFAGNFLVGVSPSVARIGILDLGDFSTRDFRLDQPPAQVLAVGGHVVVDHAAPEGLVTVLPDPRATRDEAHVLWGFFLSGLFEQELRD